MSAVNTSPAKAVEPKKVMDHIQPGKPLLVSSKVRGAGKLQMIKESAWAKGKEPVVLMTDVYDPDTLESEFRGTAPDAIVVLDDLDRALPETLERVITLTRDADRSVVGIYTGVLTPELKKAFETTLVL